MQMFFEKVTKGVVVMKKGVPIREDKNSLVEQVPDDLMGEMIRGLVELAKKNKLKSKRMSSVIFFNIILCLL